MPDNKGEQNVLVGNLNRECGEEHCEEPETTFPGAEVHCGTHSPSPRVMGSSQARPRVERGGQPEGVKMVTD